MLVRAALALVLLFLVAPRETAAVLATLLDGVRGVERAARETDPAAVALAACREAPATCRALSEQAAREALRRALPPGATAGSPGDR